MRTAEPCVLDHRRGPTEFERNFSTGTEDTTSSFKAHGVFVSSVASQKVFGRCDSGRFVEIPCIVCCYHHNRPQRTNKQKAQSDLRFVVFVSCLIWRAPVKIVVVVVFVPIASTECVSPFRCLWWSEVECIEEVRVCCWLAD